MSNNKKIEWILRIGIAGEFIGHGLLAIGGRQDWAGWITTITTIPNPTATTLLIAFGVIDVLLALLVLVKPVRPLLFWMAVWGFWTALVRPIVGVGWLDFIERFTNWAAPLALYYFLKEKKD